MLNKLKFNTLSLSFLFLMFVLTWGTTTAFAAETNIYNPSFVMSANGKHIESNVTKQKVSIYGKTVVECVSTNSTETEYKISFYSDTIKCSFHMTVSNNIVRGVSDHWIRGCFPYNVSLTCTHQYGELSFNYNGKSFTLRATVSNTRNNNISADWECD